MPAVDFPLYLVTDRTQTGGRALVPLLCSALKAGLRAIQLREKDLPVRSLMDLAEQLRGPVRDVDARLLVNDRVDVTLALDLHGVHLRADSLPVAAVRRTIGGRRVIGVSGHSVEEMVKAGEEGADFGVLGPIYETASKTAYGPPLGLAPLERAAARCRIPIFAIGGITAGRVRDVRRAGAFGVAVISAVLGAEDVEAATRALLVEATAPV